MVVIGVDFGNESCIVSCVIDGQLKTIENEFFKSKTPSCVAFTERKRLVGVSAKNQFASNPANTVLNFKQRMGNYEARPHSFDFVRIDETSEDAAMCYNVQFQNNSACYTPTHITSMLLAKLKNDANAALKDSEVSGCVLAVPSFFTDTERKSFLAAAGIAKLNCHYLIKETTAIAINYSFYKKFPKRQNVFFVDFGHSSIQIFVCAFENEKLEILAETSDRFGGRDINELLAAHFIERLNHPLATKTNQNFCVGLLEAVEKLKISLSADDASFPLNIQHLLNEEVGMLSMNQEEFEKICEPIIDRIESLLLECLIDSEIAENDINSIEIIGGSSRIPFIKRTIEAMIGARPKMTMTDEAVARGCLLRFILSRKKRNYEVIEKSEDEKMEVDEAQSSIGNEEPNENSESKTETEEVPPLVPRIEGKKMLTIKEVHSNFKSQDGYLGLTKMEFDKQTRTEKNFLLNEVEENLRYEARNKLEKLVIECNHGAFTQYLNELDRRFFQDFVENISFAHNNTKQEYEKYFNELQFLIRRVSNEKERQEREKREKLQREKKKAEDEKREKERIEREKREAERQEKLQLDREKREAERQEKLSREQEEAETKRVEKLENDQRNEEEKLKRDQQHEENGSWQRPLRYIVKGLTGMFTKDNQSSSPKDDQPESFTIVGIEQIEEATTSATTDLMISSGVMSNANMQHNLIDETAQSKIIPQRFSDDLLKEWDTFYSSYLNLSQKRDDKYPLKSIDSFLVNNKNNAQLLDFEVSELQDQVRRAVRKWNGMRGSIDFKDVDELVQLAKKRFKFSIADRVDNALNFSS